MDALLLIGGLLLLLASLGWLIAQAYAVSLFWGTGCLLPPGWLLFSIRYWQRARPCVQLAGLALVTMVVGVTMLAHRDPNKLHQLASLQWLHGAPPSAGALHLNVQGEFNGVEFRPEFAELINGVMVFREGDDLSRRELFLRFASQPKDGLQLNILPADPGPLPVVELSWVTPDTPQPEALRVAQGYTLHVNLKPGRPNRMEGEFHLVLPTEQPTSLSGQVELYTSNLRYLDDVQIDPRFNSRETVEWLILNHLRATARTGEVEFVHLPPLDINRSRLELDMLVRVAGEVQPAALTLIHTEEKGWQIAADRQPLRPVIRAEPTPPQLVVAEPPGAQVPATAGQRAAPPAPEAPAAAATPAATVPATSASHAARSPVAAISEPLDRRERFSLQRLLARPQDYRGLRLRVRTERGGIAEGQFIGLTADGRISLRYHIAGGEASFTLRENEVTRIELLDP